MHPCARMSYAVQAIAVGLTMVFAASALGRGPVRNKPPEPYTGKFNNTSLPSRTAGTDNLIVLIHGWTDTPAMWSAFKTELNKPGVLPASWQIWEYDWHEDASPQSFDPAVANTPLQADNLADQIVKKGKISGEGGWKHVQFISHSLGAPINELADRKVRAAGVTTTQQTFLDPAFTDGWIPNAGAESEVSENYFSSGRIPATGRKLKNTSNVELYPMSPYSATFSPSRNHKWPVEWYTEGIAGTNRVPQSNYGANGWGFSKELALKKSKPWAPNTYAGLKTKLQTVKADGTIDKIEDLAAAIEENRTPEFTAIAQSPGITLTTASNTRSAPNVTGIDFSASGIESWVQFDLDTRNAGGLVNALTFKYAFQDVSERQGVLALFLFDDATDTWGQFWAAQETLNLAGTALQSYAPVLFLEDLSPGEHQLAFSYTSLDGLPSEAIVRDMRFQYLAPAPGAGTVFVIGIASAGRRRRGMARA